ncbi:MAG TPA: AAA family ATPase [Clostridiaceae bacterium]|nr:AAA family ATPase [Clostridiaceae bacterium]
MHINKLQITGFGKIRDKTIELSNGLNIIYGCNEAGKSTLWWFIRGMLFGLKGGRKTKDGILPPLKRYKPWDNGIYGGVMEYTLDNGERYRVERDFDTGSARVFDAHFNDITGTFTVSRETGVQFAERHIGLNDVCFEKTALIRQMNTRIDDSGSRELISRLVNVHQTGFEDVSYKKARQVLKEALKNYVGNEKTTERPLDKVVKKILELKERRTSLINKKESFLTTQSRLNDALFEKNCVEDRMKALAEVGKIISLMKEAEGYKDKLAALKEAEGKILSIEKELAETKEKLCELCETRRQLAAFSHYSDECGDDLNIKYHELRLLQKENDSLEHSIEAKKQHCLELESRIEPFRKLAVLNENSDKQLLSLRKEIDNLRNEQKIFVSNYAHRELRQKEKKKNISTAAFFVLTVLTAICTVLGINGGKGIFAEVPAMPMFAAALFLLALAAVQAYRWIRLGRDISNMKDMKKKEDEAADNIAKKIAEKEKSLNEILDKAGVASIEDFIAAKASCDGLIQHLTMLNSEIEHMEESYRINAESIYRLKKEIIEKLLAAGIIESDIEDVKERHINEFKAAMARYKEIETAAEYLSKRAGDLESTLASLFSSVSSICMRKCESSEELDFVIKDISRKVYERDAGIGNIIEAASQQFKNICFEKPYFTLLAQTDSGQALEDMEECWKLEYEGVSRQNNELALIIKEYETLLKGIPDDEEIQGIQEQLEELEQEKRELEEKGEALRIAIDVMAEASIDLQRNFVPLLNSRMSDIISSITSGRYKELRADDNLLLKTVSPETLGVISSELLSCGTVEQIYFALRIAMAELITNGEKLPLIMDETFAFYDDVRSMEAFRLLDKLSSDRQILLFTCKSRDVEMAKEQKPDARHLALEA